MPQPRVSVIIPVFNRAHFITGAIESVTRQSLSDLEIIVVDDGSTDASVAAARSIADPRVRIVQHERNRGIPDARNTGLDEAQGQYIAWLDSDDLARPDRLQTQVRYLDQNPSVAMVGCCAGKIRPDGTPLAGIRVPPLESSDIAAWLLFRSAFQQSSITGRAAILREHRYKPENRVCEDLDVFIRLARAHTIENLPLVLVDRRIHKDQIIRLQENAIHDRKMDLLAAPLRQLGMKFTADDIGRHILLGNPKAFYPDTEFLGWAECWIAQMRSANARTQYVDADSLRFVTSFFWMRACRAAFRRAGRWRAAKAALGSPVGAALFSRRGRAWLREALPLFVGWQLS
ncbi:MAG: glycosyltransferase family 2 protein [Alphaproteobacteria bacterium]|nr:glycosyltransferase family 2 protein [Alphaproteobacteria bacterium]